MYLVDSANVVFIKKMIENYEIKGITTNPTIIGRENTQYIKLLKELKEVLNGRDFHIQLTSESFNKMKIEAEELYNLIGETLHIKVPVSTEGFKAIKYLSNKGRNVTATAVCNTNQGIMAGLCGAKSIAVYVNRITKTGMDGNKVVLEILEALKYHNLSTKVIGASYKNIEQIIISINNGIDQVTVGENLFELLFYSEVTEKAINKFTKDYLNSYKT
jgi:fructose-6-phosphate aldolase 2